MSISVIPYVEALIHSFVEGFKFEKGIVGALHKFQARGSFFGVVDSSSTAMLTPDHGYRTDAGARHRTLEFVLNAFSDIAGDILIQDLWASKTDYATGALRSRSAVLVDEAIYTRPLIRNIPTIESNISKLVSSMAVVVFIEDILSLNSTQDIVNSLISIAIEAYDGQGWLVWVDADALQICDDLRDSFMKVR